ncbi:MAG: SAM-dependent methyltransferase [Gammaproteobacteria bacterium]|nr:SAM-dependent methyltransferase [Gammaproteobacteria bacterium]
MHTGFDLPAPVPEALAHSERVRGHVIERIAAGGGFLGFADYMDAVLYAPGLGYYSAGARKFGAAGDFVTAPELGAVFARCLARQAGAALAQLRGGDILEVGGGSGALAADLLRALGDNLPDRYLLLEVSGELRERQRQTLAARVPALLRRVTWLDALPAEPLTGVLIANEVLDALPVERFRMRGGVPWQMGVEVAGTGLKWAERPARAPLADAVSALQVALGQVLPDGYTTEIGLRHTAWLKSLLGILRQGLALFLDYGGTRHDIYHDERRDGTLVGHYRHHQLADPFFLPGLQDLTAWVDFSAAADVARQAGLNVATYATQAHVLLASGVLEEGGQGARQDDPAWLREMQQIQRLLLPGEMGERFKLLALTRDFVPDLPLTVRDLKARLQGPIG